MTENPNLAPEDLGKKEYFGTTTEKVVNFTIYNDGKTNEAMVLGRIIDYARECIKSAGYVGVKVNTPKIEPWFAWLHHYFVITRCRDAYFDVIVDASPQAHVSRAVEWPDWENMLRSLVTFNGFGPTRAEHWKTALQLPTDTKLVDWSTTATIEIRLVFLGKEKV